MTTQAVNSAQALLSAEAACTAIEAIPTAAASDSLPLDNHAAAESSKAASLDPAWQPLADAMARHVAGTIRARELTGYPTLLSGPLPSAEQSQLREVVAQIVTAASTIHVECAKVRVFGQG